MTTFGLPEGAAIIAYAGLGLLALFIGVVLLRLPFAVFGIRKQLDTTNEQLREAVRLLENRFPPALPRPGENVLIRSESDDDFSPRNEAIFSSQRRY